VKRAVTLVLLLVTACSRAPEPPCSRELAALSNAHHDRQHGYTQNDDVREALNRLEDALRCVDGPGLTRLLPHARLLHARLAIKGNTDELTALARLLGNAPLRQLQAESAAMMEDVKRARTARGQLQSYAMQEVELARTPEETVRARWMMESSGASSPSPRAAKTQAIITHVAPWESCVALAPGAELPPGVAVASVFRGTTVLPLHGDSPAFQVNDHTPPLVRLCSRVALVSKDVLTLTIQGARAFEMPLLPTVEDEARGAALVALGGPAELPSACASPLSRSGRLACGWGKLGAP